MNEDELIKATAKHVVALFRTPLGQDPIRSNAPQGTLTLIRYRGHCLGLTNAHVIGDYRRPETETLQLALKTVTQLPGRFLFCSEDAGIDFPPDLAVFLLHEPSITKHGKRPIDVPSPVSLARDEFALAVGFPGHLRKETETHIQHPMIHIASTCRVITDRKIILQDNVCPGPADSDRYGGVSGGAIFALSDDAYALAGIIAEGRGGADSDFADSWIHGIPITATLLDRILESKSAKELEIQPLKIDIRIHIEDVPSA